MIRANQSEVKLKEFALKIMNELYDGGIRAALYEKRSSHYGRPDIIMATRLSKEVIICEVKTAKDKIKPKQLTDYNKMVEKVWIVVERKNPILKQISNVPDRIGLVLCDPDDETYEVIRYPIYQQIEDRYCGVLPASSLFKSYFTMPYEQFIKLYWFFHIIYARFHSNKSSSDNTIDYTLKGYNAFYLNNLKMNKFIRRFAKRIGYR